MNNYQLTEIAGESLSLARRAGILNRFCDLRLLLGGLPIGLTVRHFEHAGGLELQPLSWELPGTWQGGGNW